MWYNIRVNSTLRKNHQYSDWEKRGKSHMHILIGIQLVSWLINRTMSSLWLVRICYVAWCSKPMTKEITVNANLKSYQKPARRPSETRSTENWIQFKRLAFLLSFVNHEAWRFCPEIRIRFWEKWHQMRLKCDQIFRGILQQ